MSSIPLSTINYDHRCGFREKYNASEAECFRLDSRIKEMEDAHQEGIRSKDENLQTYSKSLRRMQKQLDSKQIALEQTESLIKGAQEEIVHLQKRIEMSVITEKDIRNELASLQSSHESIQAAVVGSATKRRKDKGVQVAPDVLTIAMVPMPNTSSDILQAIHTLNNNIASIHDDVKLLLAEDVDHAYGPMGDSLQGSLASETANMQSILFVPEADATVASYMEKKLQPHLDSDSERRGFLQPNTVQSSSQVRPKVPQDLPSNHRSSGVPQDHIQPDTLSSGIASQSTIALQQPSQDPFMSICHSQKKISMTEHYTVWYMDSRLEAITTPIIPPDNQSLNPGDCQVFAIWLFALEANTPHWTRIAPGTPHPCYKECFLTITSKKTPSWVKKDTVSRYSWGK
ncbi:hypothetical protein M422DRAFT_245957 [Sphaerobolus stellatus SS14]|nr:hypothetical protein M422DRAFT_245957 [Sphaerobolus stellatus SS14]